VVDEGSQQRLTAGEGCIPQLRANVKRAQVPQCITFSAPQVPSSSEGQEAESEQNKEITISWLC
jgi:hypothetical protein